MIKIYKIKIGDKVYEVELESITEKEGSITETKLEKNKTDVSKGNTTVESPMQALVLGINVTEGQKVSKGETLIMLEAMKMENPIVSPVDGTVKTVNVSKGQTVDTGEILVTID